MPRIATRTLKSGGDLAPETSQQPSETDTVPVLDDENTVPEGVEDPEEEENREIPPDGVILPASIPTPAPPQFKFNSDYTRGKRPNDFFRYWCSLPPEFLNRLTAYVYRNWPVIEIMVPDRKRGGLRPSSQIAKIPGEDLIKDEGDMLHRFGSGDYTIRLNDAVMRKSLALCIIKGLRDEDHPPCQPPELLDVLVMDDPANQSFIHNLRLRGILQEREREEDDMAQGQALDRLATVIEKQVESNKPAKVADPQDIASKQVTSITDAVMKGLELGQKATANETEAKVAAVRAETAATQGNPSQMLGFFREVAEVIRPAVAPQAESAIQKISDAFLSRISTLESNIMTMQNNRIADLEKRLTNPPAQAVAATAAPVGKQEDFFANLDKLVAAKDKLQTLFGGGGGEGEEREEKVPVWMQIAQAALAGLPSIAMSLLGMSYNMAVAKTGQGTPIMPNAAAPPPEVNPNPALLGVGETSIPPKEETTMNAAGYMAMLRQIERPLLNHLNDPTKGGADFAAALMDFHGQVAYGAIKELGKDTILTLLSSYPPIASVIKQIPQRTDEFIDDFLNAEEILAEGEEGEEVGGNIPGGPGNPIDPEVLPPLIQTQVTARAPARGKKGSKG